MILWKSATMNLECKQSLVNKKHEKRISMGKLEIEAAQKRRTRYVQQAVLAAIGIAGILAITMIAPNIFQAFPRVMGNKYKFGYRARTATGRLAQKGLVRFVEKGGKKYVEITDAGRRVLALEEQKMALQTRAKRRWDKRYRMVIFDIPEKRNSVRVQLRRTMRECGFMRLQDSVWVYPYDCEEIISLLKAELGIGKDVLYVIVEQIENDAWVKKHFNLA